MLHWMGTFGIMGALMTDNSGEFSSDEMRELMSIFNVLCYYEQHLDIVLFKMAYVKEYIL